MLLVTAYRIKNHVYGPGSNINSGNTDLLSGDLVVQASVAGRSTTTGTQLTFVLPADIDGRNVYGRGRIIVVAGNSNNRDATGKMILGTRRYLISWVLTNNGIMGMML